MFYDQFFIEGYCFSQKSLLEACLSQEARRKYVCYICEFEGHRVRHTHGETCILDANSWRKARFPLFFAHFSYHETQQNPKGLSIVIH